MSTTHPQAHAAKPVDKAHNASLLLALLAADYVRGDKHNFEKVRELALAALKDLGDDGAASHALLMGDPPPPAKAEPAAKAA